tara:strand:+ start:508 stop:993 length:486 start_codon:yes stop_codon:yes gene_type:complete
MYVATIQLSQTTRVNVEAATLRTTRVDESDFKDHIGAMEEVRPKRGRGRAHRISLIRVHVGVDQRCRASDEESPAFGAYCPLPTISTRNVSAGPAMEEMLQKVQNVFAHYRSLRMQTQGTQSIQWGNGWVMDRFAGRWMEVQGMFEIQARTNEYCETKGIH